MSYKTSNFVSHSQKYFSNGQLQKEASDNHYVEIKFIPGNRVHVEVEEIISDLIAEFADESNGKRAYVTDDKEWVFQLITGTGRYENPEDIIACVVMRATTASYIMLECEPKEKFSKDEVIEKKDIIGGDKFKGELFDSWFYADSLEEAKEMGIPYSNVFFEIEEGVIVACGTGENESPKEFMNNNKSREFVVKQGEAPKHISGRKVYYSEKV